MRPRGLGAHSAHAARMHVSLEEGMQLPAHQCCGSVSPQAVPPAWNMAPLLSGRQ